MMKNLKYILLVGLIVMSFYLTDKVMIYLENKNPLMQEIKAKAAFYQTNAANAKVKGNTIIPGLNGKKVSLRKSYGKMWEFGAFNETFLAFDEIKPEITARDHLDKEIIKGNPLKRAVSLLLAPNNKVESFLNDSEIQYTLIAKINADLTKKCEYLNGEASLEKASDLNALLNQKKLNKNLCLVGYSNLAFCQAKKYYLVAPSVDTSTNITSLLTKIQSGDIILIKESITLDNLNLILKEIQRQDLKIVYLSTLISESN